MTKHDDVLNELVYLIDDVVYDFYAQTNELIAKKQKQETLLQFRDQTIATINDMNVRSLAMISELKSSTLVSQRAESLLQKNREIVESALSFIDKTSDRNGLGDAISNIASSVVDHAVEFKTRFDATGVLDKIVEGTQVGVEKVKQGYTSLNENPHVIKGKEVLVEKSQEVLETGKQILKEGSKYLSEKRDGIRLSDENNAQATIYDNEGLEAMVQEVVQDEESENN